MKAKGAFDVNLIPQKDNEFPAGRMALDKVYHGDLEGTGKGQMISKRLENGAGVYFAVEEVSGTLNDQKGRFTLLHHGYMDSSSESLDIHIMNGSGSGDLAGISGKLSINREGEDHFYEITYEL